MNRRIAKPEIVFAIPVLFALATLLSAWQPPAGAIAPIGGDCALDGYVVNAVTGEPVPRAHIVLNSPNGSGGQAPGAGDNAGHWSFSHVACGPIRVMASRPGFLTGGLNHDPVILTSGSPVHDVRVPLMPTALIVGKVVDDQGDPVINAQLTVLTSRVVEGRRTFVATATMAANFSTNDLGEFRLAGLNAGKYIVCARANQRGGGDFVMLGESCYPGPIGDIPGSPASAMELAAGREARVDFTLHEIVPVHVRGVISGLPKSQGVGLTLVKRGVNSPSTANPAKIGADGKFDIAGVTPSSYVLSTDYYEGGIRLTARVPVEVGNSDADNVPVRLEPGFTLSGKVRTESKSGNVSNQQFAVSLRSADPVVGGGAAKWSADHSTFTIADLMPGSYRLDVRPPAPFFVKSAMLGGRDILREEVPITESSGPIYVILSDEGGSIDTQVTGADDRAMPGSWVMVCPEGGQAPRNLMTGADGHARLQGMAPGDYRVYAWDDVSQVEYANPDWMRRYAAGGTSVTVQAGQTAQLTLKQQTVSGY